MPRFLLLVFADATDRGPTLEVVQAMNAYNEELARAGALLALDGLHPPAAATRLRFSGDGRPRVTDGPFTEAKELVGGYWIIQARSKDEAVEWASRAPIPRGMIEVRQIAEDTDYPPEIAEAAALSQTPPEQTTATG
jgi:hypothetical protein